MSSFCLNNGFRLQENNRAARRWKQPPKKPFHRVSRDKILRDKILGVFQQPWPGISLIRHFERGEGPGNEVDRCIIIWRSFKPCSSTGSELFTLHFKYN